MTRSFVVVWGVLGFAMTACTTDLSRLDLCTGGLPLTVLIRDHLGLGEDSVLIERTPRREQVAPGLAVYVGRRWEAPSRDAMYFAVDSMGTAIRIAGFEQTDLNALACRLRADSARTIEQAWRSMYHTAIALAPFDGNTFLLGVDAPGIPVNPRSSVLLGDSVGFPHPAIQSTDGEYVGTVSVMWEMEPRVHVVEWEFRYAKGGRLLRLRERLLAGQKGLRTLDFNWK